MTTLKETYHNFDQQVRDQIHSDDYEELLSNFQTYLELLRPHEWLNLGSDVPIVSKDGRNLYLKSYIGVSSGDSQYVFLATDQNQEQWVVKHDAITQHPIENDYMNTIAKEDSSVLPNFDTSFHLFDYRYDTDTLVVMEYMTPLHHMKSLSVSLLWSNLMETLQVLNNIGIVHSDIKPDNILWSSKRNRFYLIDYGVATDDFEESSSMYKSKGISPKWTPVAEVLSIYVDHYYDLASCYLVMNKLFGSENSQRVHAGYMCGGFNIPVLGSLASSISRLRNTTIDQTVLSELANQSFDSAINKVKRHNIETIVPLAL